MRVPASPFLQPVQVPVLLLHHFGVTCELAEGAWHPSVEAFDEDVKL